MKVLQISVGIIRNPQHEIFITQRAADAHMANKLEFPGGKTVGAEEVLDRASERVKVPAIFSGDDVLRVSELE